MVGLPGESTGKRISVGGVTAHTSACRRRTTLIRLLRNDRPSGKGRRAAGDHTWLNGS